MFGRMEQHPAPNIKGFFLVIWNDWLARMSAGIFAVTLTIGTTLFGGIGRDILGAVSLLAFFVTAYRVWSDERMRVIGLERHLSPRLRIEFDARNPKFVAATRTDNGVDMLFVRVNVRALSPVVRGCRAYLTRVSQLQGDRYVSLFDEHLPMPWSNQDPNNFHVPKELNHDVDALLDVAWFAEPDNLLNRHGPFSVLNFNSIIPNGFIPILNRILQHPSQNLKLDILVTADDSENATLSLNIHRGGTEWNNPQVGWMRGNEIHHREPNF